LLGFTQNTIYNWINRGFGPPVYTFDGKYRYKRAEVEKWMMERRRA
jgi:predicted site-specific integrase-resolvase